MKKIEVFLHYARASDVVKALGDLGYRNITIQDFKGALILLHESRQSNSTESELVLIPEVRLTLVCEDTEVDAVTAIIRAAGRIGSHTLGWIYVSPVDEALGQAFRPARHNHV